MRDRGAERLSDFITQLVSPEFKGNCPGLSPGLAAGHDSSHGSCSEQLGVGQVMGGCLTGPLPSCPPQSGQAYYINDGESVNIFEWMAPLVGTQTPLPPVRFRGSPPLLSRSSFPTSRKISFHIQNQLWKHHPLGDTGTNWSWVVSAPRGAMCSPHLL